MKSSVFASLFGFLMTLRITLLMTCALSASSWGAVVSAVDSVGITVADMDRAVAFYRDVLEFKKVDEHEVTGDAVEHLFGEFGIRLRVVRMRLGDEDIELMQFLAPRGRPDPVDSRSNDRWFQHVAIIVADMGKAYTRLRAHNIEHASSGPQRLPDWNPNAGGISAFYFRDTEGNTLEILAFPPGKGAAKWQRKDALFLGIDHTAIVVANTEQSLRYYRDTLGMTVAGHSENWGTEQEHLNNVFGARLRITALRSAAGPGVELLEYLAPQGGRSLPADTQASDLWYWQVNFASADVAAGAARIAAQGYAAISSGVVTLAATDLGFATGYVARDPDGHASALRGGR